MKARSRRPGMLLVGAAALTGCLSSDRPRIQGADAESDDGGSPVDAAPPRDSRANDRPAPDVADFPDTMPDARPDAGGLPLPPGVPAPRRFLDAKTQLTGSGLSNCTQQDPPSGNGDRWCSFSVEATGKPAELWVIDISRVAAGQDVPCDGSSDGCVRLMDNTTVFPVGAKPMFFIFRVAKGGPAVEGTYLFGPTPF